MYRYRVAFDVPQRIRVQVGKSTVLPAIQWVRNESAKSKNSYGRPKLTSHIKLTTLLIKLCNKLFYTEEVGLNAMTQGHRSVSCYSMLATEEGCF